MSLNRRLVYQILTFELLLLLAVFVLHLATIRTLRVTESQSFIVNHRNDIVTANWRRMDVSMELLKTSSFSAIKIGTNLAQKHFGDFFSGRIVEDIFYDNQGLSPYGSAEFRYSIFNSIWISGAFFLFVSGIGIIGFIHSRNQVLRKVRHEEEIKRLRAITESVQMVAHDVKKPFYLVNGILSGMRDGLFQNQSDLAEMTETALRVTGQVDEMLGDIIALDSEMKLQTSTTALNDLFVTAQKMIHVRYPEITFVVNPASPKVTVDSVKMQRVFTNIMMNAAEAMKGHGTISMDLKFCGTKADPHIKIILANTNSYIPPEVCEKIFMPFFSANKTGGAGLGLAIVQKIVQAHQGTVAVRSHIKHGTEFEMTLPMGIVNAEQPEQSIPANHDTPVIKVAVVEDCSLTRYKWKKALGDRAEYFPTVSEFMDQSNGKSIHRFSHIITDFYFDGDDKTGIEVAQTAKDLGFNGAVLIATLDSSQFDANLFTGRVDKTRIEDYVKESLRL